MLAEWRSVAALLGLVLLCAAAAEEGLCSSEPDGGCEADGASECAPGFTGDDCDEVVCPGPYCEEDEAAKHEDETAAAAAAVPEESACAGGFTGDDCDEVMCPGPYCEEDEAAPTEAELKAVMKAARKAWQANRKDKSLHK